MQRLILSIFMVLLLAAPAAALTDNTGAGNNPEGRFGEKKSSQHVDSPKEKTDAPSSKKNKPKKPHPGDVLIIKKNTK